MSFANSLSQPRAPDDLDDVPAGAAEHAFELLDDLAVAAHRAVEALQVAVDDEDQVVELLAAGERDRAERFRLVAFAVAQERPDLAVARSSARPRPCEVLEEARLVDRHQRAEAHRHRRELPEVRHQPRVRIRRDALAVALLAEIQQLLLGQAAFDECARVDARRHVALHVDQVAAVVRPSARARNGRSRCRRAAPRTGSSRCGRRARTIPCSRAG